MNLPKRIFLVLSGLCLLPALSAQLKPIAEPLPQDPAEMQALRELQLPVTAEMKVPGHPRILWPKGAEKNLKKQIKKDPYWVKMHDLIIGEADRILTLEPNRRVMVGRRLLETSRQNVRRLLFLGYAWRMTGDKRYAVRAEQEMLSAAAFTDWNPAHYLDTGEMMMALGIGYDWFYDYLSPESRRVIREALYEKGLQTSNDTEWQQHWLTVEHNWNQVCNGGVLFAALALYDENPEEMRGLINRSIGAIRKPMREYAPHGGYPEGIGYWGYGTTFNVLFIDALEKAFGTDFGLSEAPGFMETGLYSQVMTTPALYQFNYGDNRAEAEFNPTVFWFYAKTRNPALLYQQKRLFERDTVHKYLDDRILPCVMLWGAGSEAPLSATPVPQDRFYYADGGTPVMVVRSAWDDPGALYLGFKGGSAGVNHGHMDIGEFFVEADGVRWAMDFGAEHYNRLETAGVQLWYREQGSQRWDVFRYKNQSHNVPTFNDKPQMMQPNVPIGDVKHAPSLTSAAADLTPVYTPQVMQALRAVSLVDNAYVVIQDRIAIARRFTHLRWNMVTEADNITFTSETTARLEKDGKTLLMKVEAPFPITLRTWSTEPDYSFDSPNPGTRFVGFTGDLPLQEVSEIRVYLVPGGAQVSSGAAPYDFEAEWPAPKIEKVVW